MIRPDYRDFRRSQFIVANGGCLMHSAKGSTWEEHKYIKRINGTYYYPDSYKGGRHLPKGPASDIKEEKKGPASDAKDGLEDWEKTMYEDIEETLKRNPGLFDPTEIASDDFQDFRLTLSEFAGIDTDKLSSEEIERMRKKVQSHYANEKAARKLDENDIENLAKEVIRGNFGNGQQRKDLLGENYGEVQKRVNEIMRGSKKASNASTESRGDTQQRRVNEIMKKGAGSKKVSQASRASMRKVEEVAKNIGTVIVRKNKIRKRGT